MTASRSTTMSLRGKTILITGGSRGIGREIALRCAVDGANVVLAAKTEEPNPKLPGTIHEVAAEVEAAGGTALAVKMDVRHEEEVRTTIDKAVARFGGIDAVVNNAGAISLSSTADTPMKRFDLMHAVNTRAVFLLVQSALPYLKKSTTPHVLSLSPPLSLDPKWYAPHLAYTLSKFGMTMCTIGLAKELEAFGISLNSLWPKRLIATAATQMLFGESELKAMRKPAIVAEAAYRVLTTSPRFLTGQSLLDEDFLMSRGVTDFSSYDITPGTQAPADLFVDIG